MSGGERWSVGLFETSDGGAVRLVGQSNDPDLVTRVRAAVAADRRIELEALESPGLEAPAGEGLHLVGPPLELLRRLCVCGHPLGDHVHGCRGVWVRGLELDTAFEPCPCLGFVRAESAL